MSVQNKHGEYEQFDLVKARWDCPKCGADAMMVETRAFKSPYKYIVNHSFKCEKCGLSTLEYDFQMKKKDSFNAAHRRFVDMWPYLVIAEKKGIISGFDAGAKFKMAVERGCSDENCHC